MPWLTLSGSNYPCLEQISMVPKMFEPLRFDCIIPFVTTITLKSAKQCRPLETIYMKWILFPCRIWKIFQFFFCLKFYPECKAFWINILTFSYFQVYDGSITEGNIIGKFCGSVPPETISSRLSSLHVQFHSDESISGRGFRANYAINDGKVL